MFIHTYVTLFLFISKCLLFFQKIYLINIIYVEFGHSFNEYWNNKTDLSERKNHSIHLSFTNCTQKMWFFLVTANCNHCYSANCQTSSISTFWHISTMLHKLTHSQHMLWDFDCADRKNEFKENWTETFKSVRGNLRTY